MKNIILKHQINEFYQIFGEVLGYKITIKVSTLKDKDFLSQVLYDISEALEGYDCDETDEMFVWLTKLFRKVATLYDTPERKVDMFAITILLAVATFVGGFIFGIESRRSVEIEPIVEEQVHTRYTAYGRYYTNGTVVTNDGNEWSYTTDTISDKTPTDDMPVWVGLDDNGTPTDITDDVILGLVYDRNTAIYDALETALSDEFELTRDGNNIHIGGNN